MYLANKYPGPDQYKINNLINGTGFSYVSKFKSSTSKSMHGKAKDNIPKLQGNIFSHSYLYLVPGVGSYILPSDFGIYESKHAKEHKN